MSMTSELVDSLKEIEDELKNDPEIDCSISEFRGNWSKTIKEATETIKELSVKLHAASMERSSQYYNGGWIPCEERLPEEKINPITLNGYDYPVTYKNGEVIDTRYYTFCNGHWYHGAGIMDEYVIAWMPLPQPYQLKEKGKK